MRRQQPFVSRRVYEAVCADRERIRGERDQFAKDRDVQRQTAEERLKTITRLQNLLQHYREEKPDSPLPEPQPVLGDAELRRQLHLARRAITELSRRLDDMQASHVADTRELHDLRQQEVTS